MSTITHVNTGERLSNKNLIAYAGGGVGRDMSYNLWNNFLLVCIMYTKGVNATQLSIILIMMAVCRVFDGINDPIMGGIIERTRSKWGKFKPWIFFGAISNALITFLIFAVPLRGTAFLIFFPFAYLLWDISFTMNDIGYWAMLPSLSSNDQDRNKLTTAANIMAGIGGGIAGILIPIFTTGDFAIGNSAVTGFTVMAAVIGLVFIGCQAMTTFCVKEKPLSAAGEKIGVKAMFKVIFKNDQLLWIALVMILYNLGSSLYAASTTNFIYFRFGYAGANVSLFGTLGGILGGVSIFFPLLSKKFSRRTISIIGILTACVGYIIMFILGSSTMTTANTQGVFAGLIICASIITIGQTMFYMVLTVSIANTIEYNEWKTGKRDEGIIFAVRPFMAKMGSALVVLFQAVIYGILRVGDVTNGISEIENNATNIIANKITSGADYDALLESAGISYEDAAVQLGDKAEHTFANIIGELKNTGIQNILDQIDENTKIWMLFGLTVIPMIFVVCGLIVWLKKYKINEKFYAEIVTENMAREAGDAEGLDGDAAPEGIISAEVAAAEAFAASAGADVPVYPDNFDSANDGEEDK